MAAQISDYHRDVATQAVHGLTVAQPGLRHGLFLVQWSSICKQSCSGLCLAEMRSIPPVYRRMSGGESAALRGVPDRERECWCVDVHGVLAGTGHVTECHTFRYFFVRVPIGRKWPSDRMSHFSPGLVHGTSIGQPLKWAKQTHRLRRLTSAGKGEHRTLSGPFHK